MAERRIWSPKAGCQWDGSNQCRKEAEVVSIKRFIPDSLRVVQIVAHDCN